MRKKYFWLLIIVGLLFFSLMVIFTENKYRIQHQEQEQMEKQKKRDERWKIIKAETKEWKEMERFRTLKEEMDDRKKQQQYNENQKEMKQKKEELIQLCAEYEEEIEMISEEILGMLEVNGVPKDGLSWEDVKNAVNQINHTEWEMLRGELQPYYPLDEPEPEGKVFFYYWSEGPFSLEILYINVDEEKKEEYLITRKYHTGIEFIKINEHLYIYLEEWQMI